MLRGEWLRDGALVCAVGANDPASRELDNVVLERAAFVCTRLARAGARRGGRPDRAGRRGVLDWLEVHELQDVVVGRRAGPQRDDDIVVFKSNGLAAWDIAAAARSSSPERSARAR